MENGEHYQNIYKECVIPSPCWMVRREDFEKCGAFNSDVYPEDYDLCFRFYKQDLKIVSSNEILHHWRDYSSRTSRTATEYADNRFLELKINWFLELDYKEENQLVLWGAGAKGKWIAKFLIGHSIRFTWVTNNKKKLGVSIYGKMLEDYSTLINAGSFNTIVAVAGQNDQDEIWQFLSTQCDSGKEEVHFFC